MAARGLRSSFSDRQARGVSALLAEQDKLAADQAALAEQKRKLTEADKRLAAQKKKVQAKLAESKALLCRAWTAASAGRCSESARRWTATRSPSSACKVPGRRQAHLHRRRHPGAELEGRCGYRVRLRPARQALPWGGGGPGSYDCSGLTRAAWATPGCRLPHNAAMQACYGTRVSAGQPAAR